MVAFVETWEASIGQRFPEPGAGAADEMHQNAARAGAEIPTASFPSLSGHTHFSAERVADELLPRVRELFRSSAPDRAWQSSTEE